MPRVSEKSPRVFLLYQPLALWLPDHVEVQETLGQCWEWTGFVGLGVRTCMGFRGAAVYQNFTISVCQLHITCKYDYFELSMGNGANKVHLRTTYLSKLEPCLNIQLLPLIGHSHFFSSASCIQWLPVSYQFQLPNWIVIYLRAGTPTVLQSVPTKQTSKLWVSRLKKYIELYYKYIYISLVIYKEYNSYKLSILTFLSSLTLFYSKIQLYS